MVQRWRCNGWFRNAMAMKGEVICCYAAARRFIVLPGMAMARHCRALFGNAMARHITVKHGIVTMGTAMVQQCGATRSNAMVMCGSVKSRPAKAKLRVAMMVTLR